MSDSQRRMEIIVGVTILIAITISIGFILWWKGGLFLGEQQTIQMKFAHAGGLTRSDVASISGVEVGRVNNITLEEDSVLVTVRLTKPMQLRRDASASIVSSELLGGKQIEIERGSAPEPLAPNQIIKGDYIPGISSLTEVLYSNRQNFQQILSDIEASMSSFRNFFGDTTGNVRKLNEAIQNLEESTNYLNEFLQRNNTSMQLTLDNIEQSSGAIRELVTSESENLQGLISSSQNLAGRLNTLADSTQIVINKMNSTESSVGRLLRDDTLYVKVNKSVSTLDSILTEFHNDPQKYLENVEFKLRIF